MEVTTTKCDTCGKIENSDYCDSPVGWYVLYREGNSDEDFWAHSRDICTDCAVAMGLDQICKKFVRPIKVA